jgi:membrane-associated phospholipid phosphatase
MNGVSGLFSNGVRWLMFFAAATIMSSRARAQETQQPSEILQTTGTVSPSAATAPDPQQPSTPSYGPDRCDVSQLRTCIRNFVHDQAGIWTSPLRLEPRDALWLLPLAGATAVSLHYDAQTLATVSTSPKRIRISNDISNAGTYGAIGVAGATYIIGKITHNDTARETGVLSAEAIVDASVVTEVLKLATDRERPGYGTGNGPFWPDGTAVYTANGSFPSEHATVSWAFAHVVADETPGHPWLHLGLYAMATAVSVTRVTSRNHFPSDVVVGSAVGYLVGGYVFRQHSDSYAGQTRDFLITPVYDAATRSYGMAITFDPAALKGGWARGLLSKSHSTGEHFVLHTGSN